MAWGSTVPGCLTGLVTVFGSLGVTVLKGTVIGNSARHEAITVGYATDMGAAVEAGIVDAGPLAQSDDYTVNCLVKVATGSTTLDIVIARAFAIFNAAGVALAANQTLDGAVTRATIGQYSLAFDQSKAGAVAQIPFAVDVKAFAR